MRAKSVALPDQREPSGCRCAKLSRPRGPSEFSRYASVQFSITILLYHAKVRGNNPATRNYLELIMTADEIKARIVSSLPRDLLIDLLDVAAARARQAHELIRDNTDLMGRSARGLEGQARFRLMEKGFQDTCELHGGLRLEGDIIPGTDLRYFQPFMRFGSECPGILLGLASMPEPRELPAKNRSRLAGVSLNYLLSPRLDLEGDGRTAKPGDIFVLFLFARDRSQGGRLQEVAIGVIGADYQGFLAYETVEAFLELYAPSATGSEVTPEALPTVALKKAPKAFKPPEQPDPDEAADGRAD